MIVKCDQCQSRFKVPDDKVTEKGVRVRCTKCQNTFRVFRPQVEPVRPVTPSPVDPLDGLIRASEPAEQDPPTRPGIFMEGIHASKPDEVRPVNTFFMDQEWDRPSPSVSTPPPPLPRSPTPAPPTLPKKPLGSFPSSSPFFDKADDDPFGSPFGEPAAAVILPSQPPPGEPEPVNSPGAPVLGDIPLPMEEEPPTASSGGPPPEASRFAPEVAPTLDETPAVKVKKPRSMVLNVAIAAAFVLVLSGVGNVYINGGRLDWTAFSPMGLVSLLPATGLVTEDVTNGLYETRSGRPVLFVRGNVKNRSPRGARVKVHAELWDGAQMVRSEEGYAGQMPTPEDLYAINASTDAEALNARLKEGVDVAPGQRVPFLLTFDAYPSDVSGLKVKVNAFEVKP